MTTTRARLSPQVLLLGLASLLNDSASEMIYPLLPIFLTGTLGATPLVVGIIEGSAEALSSLLKLAAGWWSDRVPSRKPFVVSGYALATASRLLIGLAFHWPAVLAARLIDRTGKGIRSAPRDALITDVTAPADRGRAFGFHRALDHSGAVVGPLLAMLLIQGLHVPIRQVFFWAVVPGTIGVVMLFVLLKETPRASPGTSPADEPGSPLPAPYWRALAAITIFALANSSDAYLILQAHSAGVAIAWIPLLWASHHVIKSLFSTKAGALSDGMDRRLMLIAGWLAYGVIYLVFPSAHSMTFFFVLFILYAIPFTLTEGAERAWISDLVPAAVRGRSFGYYYLATGFGTLGGTLLFGSLYQLASPRAAFQTGAALAVLAALVVAGQRQSGRRAVTTS